MHFVADMTSRVFAHPLVKVFVGHKIVEVLGHGFMITSLDKVAAFAVFDLEWNTTSNGGDDWFALGNISFTPGT